MKRHLCPRRSAASISSSATSVLPPEVGAVSTRLPPASGRPASTARQSACHGRSPPMPSALYAWATAADTPTLVRGACGALGGPRGVPASRSPAPGSGHARIALGGVGGAAWSSLSRLALRGAAIAGGAWRCPVCAGVALAAATGPCPLCWETRPIGGLGRAAAAGGACLPACPAATDVPAAPQLVSARALAAWGVPSPPMRGTSPALAARPAMHSSHGVENRAAQRHDAANALAGSMPRCCPRPPTAARSPSALPTACCACQAARVKWWPQPLECAWTSACALGAARQSTCINLSCAGSVACRAGVE